MSEVQQLHTAIRRYCIDNYNYWTAKYRELAVSGKDRLGHGYTPAALRTFPRYNVLNAILVDIERRRPEELASLDEAKRVFSMIAETAENIFTKPPNDPVAQQTMNEERKALAQFINNLTQIDLLSVAPLFYRRVLTTEESSFVAGKLRELWDVTNEYWYPINNRKRKDVEAFQDEYFQKEVGAETVRTILQSHGVKTFWEMREDRINYEAELSQLKPFYNSNEGYWCDETFGWIIYASHESSIAIGGWLLAEVQSGWANWKDRVWTTPFFE